MLKSAYSSVIEVEKIVNRHERMWSLGTDILPASDLQLMNEGIETSFLREYGAIYWINCDSDFVCGIEESGYSDVFQSLVQEGIKFTQ